MKVLLWKKRAVLAAVSAAAVSAAVPLGVFALSIDSVDIAGDALRICGKNEDGGEILLNVLEGSGTEAGQTEKIVYMAQKASENGKFMFELNIKNAAGAAEGEFTAEISDAYDSLEKCRFTYYTDAAVDAVRERINANVGRDSRDENAIAALKKTVTEDSGKLAAAYAPFDECIRSGAESRLDAFCELLSYEAAFSDNDALRTAVKKCSTIVLLGACSAADIGGNLESYADGLAIGNTSSYKGYTAMSDSEREKVAEILAKQARPYKSDKEFMKALDTAVIITSLGAQNGTDACERLLREYPEYFSLERAVSSHYKKIMKGINDGSVSSIDDINAILAQEDENGGSGGGASGGGGTSGKGGSSGGGGLSGNGAVYSPQNTKPAANEDKNTTGAADIAFADLDGFEWARDAIEELAKHGVVCGYDERTFAPRDSVTRAQLCKMICLAMSLNSYGSKESRFDDVENGEWYSDYINTLAELGIVNGVSDGKFEPDRLVTREEMAAIAYRALSVKKLAPSAAGELGFRDSGDISEFAAEAVRALASENILSGDENGCFNAGANASRAETAKLVYSLCVRCGGIN